MMIYLVWMMMIIEEVKLSTHKKFDEATAILAGDALHDLAFELLSENLRIIILNLI